MMRIEKKYFTLKPKELVIVTYYVRYQKFLNEIAKNQRSAVEGLQNSGHN